MSDHNDNRGDAPSASAIQRRGHCPSSHNFEANFKDTSSGIAREGEFMHDVVMDFKPLEEASPSQQADILRAKKQRQEIIDETIRIVGERRREERIFYRKDKRLLFSGRYDELLISVSGEQSCPCLLIDYKFGYKDVPPAKGNLQLRALATLVYWQYGYRDIYCAIISPRCGEPTVVRYEESELEVSLGVMEDICIRSMDTLDLNKLATGDWCDYCKARHICPKAWELAI